MTQSRFLPYGICFQTGFNVILDVFHTFYEINCFIPGFVLKCCWSVAKTKLSPLLGVLPNWRDVKCSSVIIGIFYFFFTP